MQHGSAVAQMLVTGNMGALALMQGASAAELLKAYGLAFSSLLDVLAGVTLLTALGVLHSCARVRTCRMSDNRD